MSGRPRKFDEDDVIRKASEVFWKKGYVATTSEDLLKAMNIGKGSFYLHFKGGKEELFVKTMEARSNNKIKQLRERLGASENKIELVKTLFYERLNTNEFHMNYGCYFGNTIVEMANINEKLKDLAAHYLSKLENIFEEVIAEAQNKKQMTLMHGAKFVARHLINLWNGMNITKRMSGQNENLVKVVEFNLKILE